MDPAIVNQLAWAYLPLTSGMSILSILVWCFYRIDRTQHERNLQAGRQATALLEADLTRPTPATNRES